MEVNFCIHYLVISKIHNIFGFAVNSVYTISIAAKGWSHELSPIVGTPFPGDKEKERVVVEEKVMLPENTNSLTIALYRADLNVAYCVIKVDGTKYSERVELTPTCQRSPRHCEIVFSIMDERSKPKPQEPVPQQKPRSWFPVVSVPQAKASQKKKKTCCCGFGSPNPVDEGPMKGGYIPVKGPLPVAAKTPTPPPAKITSATSPLIQPLTVASPRHSPRHITPGEPMACMDIHSVLEVPIKKYPVRKLVMGDKTSVMVHVWNCDVTEGHLKPVVIGPVQGSVKDAGYLSYVINEKVCLAGPAQPDGTILARIAVTDENIFYGNLDRCLIGESDPFKIKKGMNIEELFYVSLHKDDEERGKVLCSASLRHKTEAQKWKGGQPSKIPSVLSFPHEAKSAQPAHVVSQKMSEKPKETNTQKNVEVQCTGSERSTDPSSVRSVLGYIPTTPNPYVPTNPYVYTQSYPTYSVSPVYTYPVSTYSLPSVPYRL